MKRALAIALFTMLWPLTAAADVVPMPDPEQRCPAGSFANTCHGGTYCSLRTCGENDLCESGQSCYWRRLCVGTAQCGGMGGPWSVDEALGACAEDGSCETGECKEIKVCAAPEDFVSGSETDCAAGGSTPDLPLALALALLALGWIRRRA